MPKSHTQSQAGPSSPSTVRTADDATIQSTKSRVEEIHRRTTRQDEEELALRRKLVPRLAKRAYHLEDGNSWCQDWIQYQKNTHPVFGLCMYHPFHPIRLPQRIIILVGSISIGFAITNCVYLGFLGSENAGGAVNYVYDTTGKLAEIQQRYTNIELEQSLVFLLTVGSFLHSFFDMLIWYLMACFCFRPGGQCQGNGDGGRVRALCQKFGIYVAVLVVIIAVVAATSMAVVRLNEDEQRQEEHAASLAEQFAEERLNTTEDTSQFSFLLGYALELVVALFIFYFFTSTVFFSGVLGCGRLPVLGGRPYEMRKSRMSTDDDENEEENDGLGLQAYSV